MPQKEKEKKLDEVKLICPGCESFVRVTTYSGDCDGSEYALEEAPIQLKAEVSCESMKGRVVCFSCGLSIAVVIDTRVTIRHLSEQRQYMRYWAKYTPDY